MENHSIATTNPALLLQQALAAMMAQVKEPPRIDYEAITRAAIKTVNEEKARIFDKVLITKNEANISYGKAVINALVKRGLLQEYRFDTRIAVDREGNEIKKAKGVIYFRLAEIEQAVEDGNIYKGTRRGTI